MVKVVRYGYESGEEREILETDTIIGRGFMNSDDKRISRNHALIRKHVTETETSVVIKSLHPTNPTFYRKRDASSDSMLQKDETVLLVTGDKFRLIPDGEWFVVMDKDDNAGEMSTENDNNIQTTEEALTDEVVSTNEIASEISSATGIKRKNEFDDSTTDVDASKRNRLEENDTMPSTSSVTHELSSNIGDVPPMINIKPDPDGPASHSTNPENSHVTSTSEIPPVNIKTDPESLVSHSAHPDQSNVENSNISSATITLPTKIKTEPDGIRNPQNPHGSPGNIDQGSPGALRPSCEFGIRCYRAGSDHRSSFAHPGDLDYRRPNFPPAPQDAPFCPFGSRCYRRNPVHFQEYQHPDPSIRTLGRPNRCAAVAVNPNHDEDDEYDDDDQDFSANSSDEYSLDFPSEDSWYSSSEDEDFMLVEDFD